MWRQPAEWKRRGRTTFCARASRWGIAVILSGIFQVAPSGVPSARACSVRTQLESDASFDRQWPSAERLAGPIRFAGAIASCSTPGLRLIAAIDTVLVAGGIVFLGEVHDNPEHHAMRAEVLGRLNHLMEARGKWDAIGFVTEHLRTDQMSALASRPASVDAFFAAVQWDQSGWPDKAMFAPLYRSLLDAPLFAGEPERGRVRDMARQGLKALPADEVSRLKLDVLLPDAQQDALLSELEASHCGLMPKTAFGTMAVAQRYRDAFLADAAMTAAAKHGSAIVFTGNGHARRDRGAPFAMKQRGFDKPVLVVLFMESSPDNVDPAIAEKIGLDHTRQTQGPVRRHACPLRQEGLNDARPGAESASAETSRMVRFGRWHKPTHSPGLVPAASSPQSRRTG